MKRRLRSPSLFVTFAGAFLGVLVLGALLQAFVVFRLGRGLLERLDNAHAAFAVRELATAVSELLERSGDSGIRALLESYGAGREGSAYAYRTVDGRVVMPSRFPTRLALHLERMLAGAPPAAPLGGPGSPDPFGPFHPRGQRGPVIVARHPVEHSGTAAGEVLALRLGPPPPLSTQPFGPHAGLLLLSLPLAILLAAVAGLLVFRTLLRRLRELETLAGRISEGDLAARVHDPAPDEIGRLGTALNRMTERLALARDTVVESDRQRRQLLADISHELGTPLTSIQGYTETLLDPGVQLSDAERQAYLRNVVEASQRMGFLIQDLLELTRFEAGAVALVKERLDWTALSRNTMQRFQPQYEDAGLQLVWEGPAAPAWIVADGRRIEQVVDNLLVNALRYVPAPGRVTLALDSAPAGGQHRLVVADDGPGFPAEDLQHVFDRFYRGSRAAITKGSGLGLAIVKEIVRQHGGAVSAANRGPRGAVVTVELPAT